MFRFETDKLAWAAGFFEGEGCFPRSLGRRRGHQICAKLRNCDREMLSRFASILRCGNIGGPFQRKPTNKPQYEWRVENFEHVQAVIALMWKWLGSRRRARAREMLRIYRDSRVRPRHVETLSFAMFGKAIADQTLEERRKYACEVTRRYGLRSKLGIRLGRGHFAERTTEWPLGQGWT
jgi:hypothetical protein